MSMFENWKACVTADSKLTRENDCWFDFRGKQIASLCQHNDPNEPDLWVLLGYRHCNYTGDIYYELLGFTGNPDVPNPLDQLLTLLDLTTPEGIEYEILEHGKLDIEDTGEGSAVLFVNDYEFAEIVALDNDFELRSDLLTADSLAFLDDLIWRLYVSTEQESTSDS